MGASGAAESGAVPVLSIFCHSSSETVSDAALLIRGCGQFLPSGIGNGHLDSTEASRLFISGSFLISKAALYSTMAP